jgi:hypothetical protein
MSAAMAQDLGHYLQESRDAVVRSLDGLSEYDVRRPLVPSGTNLLGLVKHLTGIELGYLGASVGRPSPVSLPWEDDGSWQHSDESLASVPLDAPAAVAWWPEERRATTFGHLVARVVAETAQHAGHCDIVRELIDGRGGRDASMFDDEAWAAYVGRIQAAADSFRED